MDWIVNKPQNVKKYIFNFYQYILALVGYEIGYSQLGPTGLVGYLPSPTRARWIIVKYMSFIDNSICRSSTPRSNKTKKSSPNKASLAKNGWTKSKRRYKVKQPHASLESALEHHSKISPFLRVRKLDQHTTDILKQRLHTSSHTNGVFVRNSCDLTRTDSTTYMRNMCILIKWEQYYLSLIKWHYRLATNCEWKPFKESG